MIRWEMHGLWNAGCKRWTKKPRQRWKKTVRPNDWTRRMLCTVVDVGKIFDNFHRDGQWVSEWTQVVLAINWVSSEHCAVLSHPVSAVQFKLSSVLFILLCLLKLTSPNCLSAVTKSSVATVQLFPKHARFRGGLWWQASVAANLNWRAF